MNRFSEFKLRHFFSFLPSSQRVVVLDNEKRGVSTINNCTSLVYSTASQLLIKINDYQLFREQRNRFK